MSLEPDVLKELIYVSHAFSSPLSSLSVPDNSSMTVLKSYVLFQPVPWALTALT